MTSMSTQDGSPLGLRERKKIKLRRTIQAEALRLFETQGYDKTTVEQIADAAETSTTTFYRYFPTKEDIVLDDEFDSLVEATIANQPSRQPLTATIRAAAAAIAAAAETDRDQNLTRLQLIATVPALAARYAGEQRKTINLLTRLLGDRADLPRNDYQLQLTAAALVAVLLTASQRWASEHGTTPLATLLDQAVTTIEPVLAALQHSSALQPQTTRADRSADRRRRRP